MANAIHFLIMVKYEIEVKEKYSKFFKVIKNTKENYSSYLKQKLVLLKKKVNR